MTGSRDADGDEDGEGDGEVFAGGMAMGVFQFGVGLSSFCVGQGGAEGAGMNGCSRASWISTGIS